LTKLEDKVNLLMAENFDSFSKAECYEQLSQKVVSENMIICKELETLLSMA